MQFINQFLLSIRYLILLLNQVYQTKSLHKFIELVTARPASTQAATSFPNPNNKALYLGL